MSRCSFRPTAHVKHRMIDKGISKEEIIEAVLKGAKRIQPPNKIVSAFGKVETVYRQYPCNYMVITTYWRE